MRTFWMMVIAGASMDKRGLREILILGVITSALIVDALCVSMLRGASNDEKAVMKTYKGKHNHDVPAGRHSSHDVVGSISQAQAVNTAVSGSVVTNAIKNQQIVNKRPALSGISESRSEEMNDANTDSGGVVDNALTIYNSHGGSMQIAAPSLGTSPLSTYPTNEGRSLGNDDNVAVSETTQVLRKPKEEQ